MGHHAARRPGRTDTWLTPKHIIDDLGGFDLDPCAAPEPRPWPTAARHITWPENGLLADWGDAFVWCNPPFADLDRWLRRSAEHGHGLALAFARTETQAFFRHVWDKYAGALFLKGRLAFHRPDGSVAGRAPAPALVIGWGDEALRRLARSRLDGHLVVAAAILLDGEGRPATTWREVVEAGLAGRPMRVRDLYAAVGEHARVRAARARGADWKAQVRRALQVYCEPVAYGVWRTA